MMQVTTPKKPETPKEKPEDEELDRPADPSRAVTDVLLEAIGDAAAGLGPGHPVVAAGAAGLYVVHKVIHEFGFTPENAHRLVSSVVHSLVTHYHSIKEEMGSGMAGSMRQAENLNARPEDQRDSVYLSLKALDAALRRINPKDLSDAAEDEPRDERGRWTSGAPFKFVAVLAFCLVCFALALSIISPVMGIIIAVLPFLFLLCLQPRWKALGNLLGNGFGALFLFGYLGFNVPIIFSDLTPAANIVISVVAIAAGSTFLDWLIAAVERRSRSRRRGERSCSDCHRSRAAQAARRADQGPHRPVAA
jgi:hypothetical protein